MQGFVCTLEGMIADICSNAGDTIAGGPDVALSSASSQEHSLPRLLDPKVTELERNIYHTVPLREGQIRLLKFWPSRERRDAEIEAIMFKVSFDDVPNYDTLSYHWEGSTDRHYISVNGVRIPVRDNLFYALKELRDVFEGKEFPILQNLWVDSICIDQASVEERTKQVSLMGHIYSKASTVRVWIGKPESVNVGAAFDLIDDSLGIDRDHRGPRSTPEDERWRSAPGALVMSNRPVGVKALTELLSRSYWNRMWVFQEVVLAQKAVVHCGAHSIPWERFKQFDAACGNHGTWSMAKVQHQEIHDLRKALFRIAHLFVSQTQAIHIRNVLLPTRHLQCQDPRDKLYALLGVCGTLAKTIQPNYALSTRDVYVDFSKSRIRADGDLSSLVTAGLWTPAHGDDIGLPSWVPDLRSMKGVNMRYLAGTTLERFNADGPHSSEVRFFDNDITCILETQAFLVDVLLVSQDLEKTRNDGWRELVKTFCLKDDATISLLKLQSFFRAIVFEDASFFDQAQDSLIDREIGRGIWKGILKEIMDQGATAVNSRDYVKKIQERALIGLISGFFEELKRHFSNQNETLIQFLDMFNEASVSFREHLLQERSDPDERHLHWLEFLARADETMDKGTSAIFSTQHDRIGTGPLNIRQGDYIALLRGCRVPLVLRQDGSFFRLVGPCYVSGIMQGEVWTDEKKQNISCFETVQII